MKELNISTIAYIHESIHHHPTSTLILFNFKLITSIKLTIKCFIFDLNFSFTFSMSYLLAWKIFRIERWRKPSLSIGWIFEVLVLNRIEVFFIFITHRLIFILDTFLSLCILVGSLTYLSFMKTKTTFILRWFLKA